MLHHITGVNNVAMGLEVLSYAKSNKLFPTYVLMQKVWNKARQLQDINGFTGFRSTWDSGHYEELQSFPCGPRWKQCGITLMIHIVSSGKLNSFASLQAKFNLPQSMYFPYMQLHHAVMA